MPGSANFPKVNVGFIIASSVHHRALADYSAADVDKAIASA
ncbi:hypothetical protein [uncultured Sphingomonas sp.]|nr:hypothetical protein [uncultured Sphingomonas sp.]